MKTLMKHQMGFDCYFRCLLHIARAANVLEVVHLVKDIIFVQLASLIGIWELINSVILLVPSVIMQIVLQRLASHVLLIVLLVTKKKTVFLVMRPKTIENYLPLLKDAFLFPVTTKISLQLV